MNMYLNQRRTICPQEPHADTWIGTLYRLPTGALTHPEQKQHQILYKLQDHLQNKGIFKQMINVFHSVICITGLKIEIELEKIFLSRMFVLILSEDKKSHHSEALE